MYNSKPIGVVVVSAIYVILGALKVISALFVIPFGLAICICAPGVFVGGAWGLLTGIIEIIFGTAFWSGKNWAFWLLVFLAGLNILGNIFNALTGNPYSLVSILWNAFVIWYMQTPGVKRHFGQLVTV